MKNYLARIAMVGVIGIAGLGIVGAAVWDKKTIITINEAMQVPNATLRPGTYVIRLVDSPANRHIVRFFDKDEKHVIATILAVPNERLKVTGKSVFAFWEVPAGQPKALRAWFYPGDDFGQEFAYPKDEAAIITASNSSATVPINDEKLIEVDNSATSSSTSVAIEEPVSPPVAVATPEPAPAPVEVAAAPAPPQQSAPPTRVETPAPAPAPETYREDAQRTVSQTAAAETLPRTASNVPLFALIGFLFIFGALALNLAYHRS